MISVAVLNTRVLLLGTQRTERLGTQVEAAR